MPFFDILAVVGTFAVAASARHAWREPGHLWRKLNSAALLLACFAAIWVAFSLHLLSPHLNY
ncbi:hypothetical protein [Dyella tabacisoli]|uniref:hypothetical protein n=1 Tax=Dyella tabacisoli TaxID=2282381 RepID=UPI0013B3CA41|nr:hypothetical protein [Dyella tabacisoli]